MQDSKQDNSNQITISVQDAENVNRLLSHFNLTRTKEYDVAFENYKNNPENPMFAKTMIYETAKALREAKGKSELLDNVYADILSSCEKISYDMQFDMDLEDIVGVDVATPDQASDS